jgi:hypothetical protein
MAAASRSRCRSCAPAPPAWRCTSMPIFAWAMLVTSLMIDRRLSAADPGLSILLELERAAGWAFFDPTRGGDPLLWQHLFWLFGHPEVYIIFLPAAGMVSTLVPVYARRPLVGYRWVVVSMIGTGFISFGLWVHHMFTVGIPALAQAFFSRWPACWWPCPPASRCSPGSPRCGPAARCGACRCCGSRLPGDLRRRRADRRDAGLRALQLAGARHALRRRALPLRADRRHAVPADRRHLPLAAALQRPHAVAAPGEGPASGSPSSASTAPSW